MFKWSLYISCVLLKNNIDDFMFFSLSLALCLKALKSRKHVSQNNPRLLYGGVLLLLQKQHTRSGCLEWASKYTWTIGCLSVLPLPQKTIRDNDVLLFCLLSQKAENIKIRESTALWSLLVFEYPQIHPGLFCLKYSNLHTTPRCGLLKMPEELGDILLLSGSFYGSVNCSGYISQTVHSAPACSAPLALFLDISTALDIYLKHHRLLLIG
jgi:hypothetical protein